MREVGSNFDKEKADEIFNVMDKTTEKKISENLKKEMNISKDISNLLNQAKSSDDKTAIGIYEKILSISPDNFEAYQGLSDIYQKTNDVESERNILKKAIQNLNGSKKETLAKRLKEINL